MSRLASVVMLLIGRVLLGGVCAIALYIVFGFLMVLLDGRWQTEEDREGNNIAIVLSLLIGISVSVVAGLWIKLIQFLERQDKV